ncbi:MAG: phosphopantetheine-binding protein [Eubacteriales bacterium]|nr:phosphopantetheine-binding protein [Eubacteriales bacterium]
MGEMEKLLGVLTEVDDEIDFAKETALVDDGLIDSIALTQIIAGLDEAFGIQIKTGDIEPENFNNVQAMLEFIRICQARP